MQPLGRVLDPDALDACQGSRAQLRIEVPIDWLTDGASLLVSCPRRLRCARCEGGGCDDCQRSGAYRAPSDVEDRTIETQLPPSDGSGVIVRLTDPFEGCDIDQLLLEIHPGPEPTAGVERLVVQPVLRSQANELQADHPSADRMLLIGWVVIMAAAALAIALLR